MALIETTQLGVMAGRQAFEFFQDKITPKIDKQPSAEAKKCYCDTIILSACAKLSHLVESPEEFEQRINMLIEMMNDIGGNAGESPTEGGGGSKVQRASL